MTGEDAWWRRGVIYQIYPRSFQDSNGDGIGDLQGIRQRLPHLQRLGVDAAWISPIYTSPMADFGYDVADYCGIDPRFGTLDDFDALIADAHARGLRVILDFVPNHSSSQHPWFLESRSSRSNPKRDWYLWRDPAPGGPPNNWLSNFGGPAWTFEAATGQYYAHAFLPEQPDLNWRNPEVRAAMYDALRFWLRRGVDGFRVDVIYHVIKDAQFRDNPPNPAYVPGRDPESHAQLPQYTVDQPEVQQVVAEMRSVLDAFSADGRERVLIGEIYLPIPRLVAYYGANGDGLLQGAQLPFNFHLIGTAWQADAIDRVVRDYEAALPAGAQPNWVLGNHDKPRIASRVRPAGARLAAMLLLTLRGTPTLYYGDEIGMTDVPIPPDEVQDPFEKNEPGKGLGRDPQRTPMPWSDAPNAGFTTGTPWLRLGADAGVRNVQAQAADAGSMLSLYGRLLAWRRERPALHAGAWEPLGVHGQVQAYARTHEGGDRVLVLLNFGDAPAPVPAELQAAAAAARAWLSTSSERASLDRPAMLLAHEGLMIGG